MTITDEPQDGFYRMRLVRGGPLVGVRIWFGAPLEPWTREEMDRGPRWNAEVNGDWIEVDRVWPQCAGDRIDGREYEFLKQRTQWARRNDGYDAMANPRRRTNWDDSSVPSLG